MNYIVFDLEWNQSNTGREPEIRELPFEIIEIGAIKLNNEMKFVGEFSQLVKPEVYQEMHYITRKLIHMQMEELQCGKPFPLVIDEFLEWCGKDSIFCTWGPLDLVELQRNMSFYNMQPLSNKPFQCLDVQKLFSLAYEDGKKRRNLEVSEMVSQILMVEEETGKRISHIVLMGIGEPFDNYDNVLKFIDIVNCGKGIDIGSRHITVSTCGIVPKIKEFANYTKQVNLAISLHAPNNEIRNSIMNINKAYPIEEVINAVKDYIAKTNRRVTFEYIMLKDINDSESCANELSKLLKGMNAYVNIIPYNETSHIEYKKSEKETIMKFYDTLKKNNIGVTIRREFGSKVNAACGQLRSHYEED